MKYFIIPTATFDEWSANNDPGEAMGGEKTDDGQAYIISIASGEAVWIDQLKLIQGMRMFDRAGFIQFRVNNPNIFTTPPDEI